jgi:electron transport complex protein RnfB
MGGGGMGRGLGAGAGGRCVCPACGEKVPHPRGVPCYQVKCPKCGQPMVRGT